MSIELYNQDCFEFLNTIKEDSVDLILTDPPYNISRETRFKNTKLEKYASVDMEFGEWDKSFTGLDEVVGEFYRVLKPNGTVVIFYDLWKISELKESLEKHNFKQLRFLEWLKTNPVPLNSKLNYLTNAREVAVSGCKIGKPTFNSSYDNGVYEYPIYHKSDRFHPTQKPVELFEDLVVKHSNRGDLVLDCFCGSGTTAIACWNLDRDFVGCELDEEYYGLSWKRINEFMCQQRLM